MQRQQHHHRPRRLPPPALQFSPQLLDLAAWTLGEHADRAHTDHDLAGRMDVGGNLDRPSARLMSTAPHPAASSPMSAALLEGVSDLQVMAGLLPVPAVFY